MRPVALPATVQIFNSFLQAQVSSLRRTYLTHRRPIYSSLTTRPRQLFSTNLTLPNFSSKMDTKQLSHTQSEDELATALKALGISKVPQEPNTYPALNPVDIYRSHITELLAPLAGVENKIVYNALQWTAVLEKGDLVLAVPALRLKGKKPPEIALELSEKVKKLV
jgi:hypothetical protein